MGTTMLKTKMRALSFVVHLIGEEGVHRTLPTLKIKNTLTLTVNSEPKSSISAFQYYKCAMWELQGDYRSSNIRNHV